MVKQKAIEDIFIIMMIFMKMIIKMVKEKAIENIFIIMMIFMKDDERECHGKYIIFSGSIYLFIY
jgi:hypothetical protein